MMKTSARTLPSQATAINGCAQDSSPAGSRGQSRRLAEGAGGQECGTMEL